MAIESICSGCGKRLRVQDEHVGKNARCPACKTIYIVGGAQTPVAQPTPPESPFQHDRPSQSPGPVQTSVPSTSPSSLPAQPPATGVPEPSAPAQSAPGPMSVGFDSSRHEEPQWMFRSENGMIYGPVNREGLNRWTSDGRVSRDCYLQLVGGDGRWEPAVGWIDVSLLSRDQRDALQPLDSRTHQTTAPAATVHYRPAQFAHTTQMRGHRGGLIFFYGILGIGCPVFSVLAWAVGYGDLGRMTRGEMDPAGRGMTQAGMILGIVMGSIQALFFFVLLVKS